MTITLTQALSTLSSADRAHTIKLFLEYPELVSPFLEGVDHKHRAFVAGDVPLANILRDERRLLEDSILDGKTQDLRASMQLP